MNTAANRSTQKRGSLAKREAARGYLLISPWIVGLIVFTVGPMIASAYFAFSEYSVLTSSRWIGLGNFVKMFDSSRDPLFFKSLGNTAYFVAFSVPLNLIVAFAIALLLNAKVPGMNFFRTMYYLPSLTPAVASAMIWGMIFSGGNYGLVNIALNAVGLPAFNWLFDIKITKLIFVIMGLWGVGTSAVIFLAGLQNIPEQLYEAAKVDGAGRLPRFLHVTLPMMTPVIFFNLVQGIIGSFQIFTGAYIITQGAPANSTLFYVLYLYNNAFKYFKMGYASAMAWVLFVIILVFTLIQIKLARSWVYYEVEL